MGRCRQSWPLPVPVADPSPPPADKGLCVEVGVATAQVLASPPRLTPFLQLCSACQVSLLAGCGEPALWGHGLLRPSDAGIFPPAFPCWPGLSLLWGVAASHTRGGAKVERGKLQPGHLGPTWPREAEPSAAGWHARLPCPHRHRLQLLWGREKVPVPLGPTAWSPAKSPEPGGSSPAAPLHSRDTHTGSAELHPLHSAVIPVGCRVSTPGDAQPHGRVKTLLLQRCIPPNPPQKATLPAGRAGQRPVQCCPGTACSHGAFRVLPRPGSPFKASASKQPWGCT